MVQWLIISVFVAIATTSLACGQCISGERDPVNALTRQVLTPSGTAIAKAEVTVSDASGNVLFKTHSNAKGKYSIPRIKNDDRWLIDKDFRVKVSAAGYIRYQYRLRRSANIHGPPRLTLVPSSRCNDVKIIEDEPQS